MSGRSSRPALEPGVRRHIVEATVYDARLEAERMLGGGARRGGARARRCRAEAERLRAKADGRGARARAGRGDRAARRRARGRGAVARGAEAELRALAVRIAEKILGRELSLRPDAVVDVAAEALRLAGEPREVLVRCTPTTWRRSSAASRGCVERVAPRSAVSFRADEQGRSRRLHRRDRAGHGRRAPLDAARGNRARAQRRAVVGPEHEQQARPRARRSQSSTA